VTFDSLKGNQFVVHSRYGSNKLFVESNHGLYISDMMETSFLFNKNSGMNNNYKYSSCDYSRATFVSKIHRIIGRLSTNIFIHLVENNLLRSVL